MFFIINTFTLYISRIYDTIGIIWNQCKLEQLGQIWFIYNYKMQYLHRKHWNTSFFSNTYILASYQYQNRVFSCQPTGG